MCDQIVSRSMIFDRGAAAFNAGLPRDSHNMNWHAPALPDWLAGYDCAAQESCALFRKQAEAVVA